MIDIDDEIIIASEVDVVYEYEVFGRSRAGAYIYTANRSQVAVLS
jgi:hypothetical protein